MIFALSVLDFSLPFVDGPASSYHSSLGLLSCIAHCWYRHGWRWWSSPNLDVRNWYNKEEINFSCPPRPTKHPNEPLVLNLVLVPCTPVTVIYPATPLLKFYSPSIFFSGGLLIDFWLISTLKNIYKNIRNRTILEKTRTTLMEDESEKRVFGFLDILHFYCDF